MIEIKTSKTLQSAAGSMTLELDYKVAPHDFVALYGASGSGKTTTLQLLAGLTQPEKGYIKVNDKVWLDTESNVNLPPQQRKIGYVFQDYALFPNMSVRENLLFALENKKDQAIIAELLETMELKGLEHQKPHQLSGGQQQRVALARALVRRPELLLLDEPLSAIDTEMRLKLQDYLLLAHQKYQLTTLLVSHDIAEIYKLSNRVLVLEKGQITQDGCASAVFSTQTSSGKFQFMGTILKIEKEHFLYIVSVLIGHQLVKVVAMEEEINTFAVGEKIAVSSKAFNPILNKLR
ncbi:ATP-binding cassette domain-containing protein [Flavobacterium agrisoli]|uniref:ATP-binding cassette domain-containing protein n=1 Tax=Flavobacterium agrisoli TaxID=2793066 RepID=A0A934PR45_9FLAO|nr:ATP-binding cassette domain-containing protein [Flavobacterium agrisoli]MBK0371061.1 ATP-binding cassette domain-containing protein [Flavobacterium agrisoli]